MKYTVLALAAALVAIALSSCACQPGKARHTLSLAVTAEHEVCCSPKPSPAPAANSTGTCADPMSAACGGNCTPGDCRCVKHACKCAPKVVAKPKPKPAPKVVVAEPAPLPPAKIVASPPPPPITVSEGWSRYKWEFKDPPNGVRVAPGEPLPPGVYPNPTQDGFWMKGAYSERQIPAPR